MRRCCCFVGVFLVLSSIAVGSDLTVYATVRDFSSSHADFEIINWSGTPAAWFANNQTNKIEKGIVGPLGSALGADGKPVYSSTREPGFYNTVTSATTFGQWFKDVAGVNQNVGQVPLVLTDMGNGLRRYHNESFFPIDGRGLGNEGNTHNFHYTMEVHFSLTYTPGLQIGLASDDDSWLFVNGQLVADFGGIHGFIGDMVDLSTLGLTPGQPFTADVFFADRNRYGSGLHLSTQIVPEPSVAGLLLAGCAATTLRRRRR